MPSGYLSATDSQLVAERCPITEHARGLKRTVHVAQTPTAEGHELLGVKQADDEGLVMVRANGEGEAADANETSSLAP